MATEKSALRVTELDFDTIKENLKTYLRSQDEFTDYDFEGSGMSILLDILAYNTHYMGYYLNMTANEMFLDTSQLRASVLSHAKSINYIPGSRQGATAKIDITVTPSPTEDLVSSSVTLDKYTRLLGSDIEGVNYPFVTLYSNTASKVDGSFNFSNVYIKQGEVVTLQYLMTPENDTRRFEIPSANVDIDTLTMTVQESSSNTDTVQYYLAKDITEVDNTSLAYFIEENENLNYTFYFGDNIIGKRPKDGNIVICTYLDTVGTLANNIAKFSFIQPIGSSFSDNVIVTTANSSYGGAEKESVDQIRFRAPYYYTTQNRAVTKPDYEALMIKDYNFIDSVSVWGGEENDPVIYGKVFVSVKTKGNYYLTNLEKERLKNSLIETRSILTVTPEIIDPDYTYVILKGKVTYNQSLTSKTAGELLQLVKAAVEDYNATELNKFDATFRKSKLQSYIDNCEKSITGSDIAIYIQKRFLIDTDKNKTYTIQYNLPLRSSSQTEKLSSFPEIEVYDAYGVSRQAFIEEVPTAKTGIYSIEMTDHGINYLTPPTVTISGDGSGATAIARIVSGRVQGIEIVDPGTNYTSALATITSNDNGSGAAAVVKLESEIGTLRTVYYKTNGEKVVISENVGTIDYTLGKVILDSMRIFSVTENAFYDDGYLTLTIPSENDTIPPLRNRISSIDFNDARSIQIEMVAE